MRKHLNTVHNAMDAANAVHNAVHNAVDAANATMDAATCQAMHHAVYDTDDRDVFVYSAVYGIPQVALGDAVCQGSKRHG